MRMKGKQDIKHADADSVAQLMAQMSEMRAKMDCLARDNEALFRELEGCQDFRHLKLRKLRRLHHLPAIVR